MLARLLCWIGLHAWERVGIKNMPGGTLHYEECRRHDCNRVRMRGRKY